MKNKELQAMKDEFQQLTERIKKLQTEVESYPARHTFDAINQLVFMNGYQINLKRRIDAEQARRTAVYGGK